MRMKPASQSPTVVIKRHMIYRQLKLCKIFLHYAFNVSVL